jgi:hypothetical protein
MEPPMDADGKRFFETALVSAHVHIQWATARFLVSGLRLWRNQKLETRDQRLRLEGIMPEPADHPPRPLRTWRPMAAWTAGMLLALGLAWFVGAVAVPVWQVRREVLTVRPRVPALGDIPPLCLHEAWDSWQPGPAVDQLGGPDNAVSKLGLYLRLPNMIAPRKDRAAKALGSCAADKSVPVLEGLLLERDVVVRQAAAEALKKIRGGEPPK